MAGFTVNLDALDEAADGVTGTIEIFNKQQVSAIPFEPSWTGEQELSGAMSGFLSGWQRGVQNLVTDAASIAGRLAESAEDYHKADGSTKAAASAVFQGTGTDPGMQPWQS